MIMWGQMQNEVKNRWLKKSEGWEMVRQAANNYVSNNKGLVRAPRLGLTWWAIASARILRCIVFELIQDLFTPNLFWMFEIQWEMTRIALSPSPFPPPCWMSHSPSVVSVFSVIWSGGRPKTTPTEVRVGVYCWFYVFMNSPRNPIYRHGRI